MEDLGMNKLSFWNGKRIFITGHTGFKGSWLCKILEFAGADVIGYALEPTIEPNLFNICKPKVHSFTGDIRDFDTLYSSFISAKPEIVIHMAAQPLVLDSYENPMYTYDVNVMGTVNILECVRQSKDTPCCVLNVTTDKVYLNKEQPNGYSEDEQLNGYDPYSNSKSCSELVTSSYNNSFLKQAGIAVSTARSGNVIGGGDFSENRLIPDCARAAFTGSNISIRNPNSIRPYQHVLDTLFAYLLIVQKQYENPSYADCYNIGPAEFDCKSSADLASLFCAAWGDGLLWKNTAVDNPHESGTLRLDCRKMNSTFDWNPVWNIDVAIEKTVSWYREYARHGDIMEFMQQQINDFILRKSY